MDEKSSYQSEFLGSTTGHAVSNEQMLEREVILHTAAYSPRVVGWPVKGSMPLGQSLKKVGHGCLLCSKNCCAKSINLCLGLIYFGLYPWIIRYLDKDIIQVQGVSGVISLSIASEDSTIRHRDL